MNINDMLEKCLEIPEISVKQNEYRMELILDSKDGTGQMAFFSLFPGITLAYIHVNAALWKAPDMQGIAPNGKGFLLFNYCVEGRCELELNNQNYVYVKEREMSLTEHFAQDQYVYPSRLYKGIEFFIDTDTFSKSCPYAATEYGIDFSKLIALYCPGESTFISASPDALAAPLGKLWESIDLPFPFALTQMRIYTLALFSALQNRKEIPATRACAFFTKTQVDIAKRTEQILTADLRQHHPARELAEMFSISETSLKNYFRGVFGQNPSAYLKKIRLNTAAHLIATTKCSISEIAEQVGYLNQSKFATVFKNQFGMSPLEYRRVKALENSGK